MCLYESTVTPESRKSIYSFFYFYFFSLSLSLKIPQHRHTHRHTVNFLWLGCARLLLHMCALTASLCLYYMPCHSLFTPRWSLQTQLQSIASFFHFFFFFYLFLGVRPRWEESLVSASPQLDGEAEKQTHDMNVSHYHPITEWATVWHTQLHAFGVLCPLW